MTGPEIMGVVGFIVMLFGFLFGLWKYVEGHIKTVHSECGAKAEAATALAALTRQELSDYKLRAAETFATKAGMQEQTSQIMRAIESVANRIDGLTERMDRVFEQKTTRARG
jgi:cobalamin biosynthesis protein CbiD